MPKYFFGIKEHTVMLLSVVLSYLRRQSGQLQDINRKRKRGDAMPVSCESRPAPDKGHTGRDSCLSPGEGVAQGGGRQQSSAAGGQRSPPPPQWCDCSQDFLVNFNVWDRDSPWSPPQPRVGVCVNSLTAGGSRTTLLCRPCGAARVAVPVCLESLTHTQTHTHPKQ